MEASLEPTTKCSLENSFLLFIDGGNTRYTTETIVLAKQLGCHIIVTPFYATHFIGLTDKTCHGPYHVRYSKCEKLHLKDDTYITWAPTLAWQFGFAMCRSLLLT